MTVQNLVELSLLPVPESVRAELLAGVEAAKASGLKFVGEFAIHHVISRKAIENSNFINEVYGLTNYEARMNTAANLIALPTNSKDAIALGMSQQA